MQALPVRAPFVGLHRAHPHMLSHLRATTAQQALLVQLHITVLCTLRQNRHGGQIAHAVGPYVPLLVAGELVQGRPKPGW